jgi:DNA ligase (NAD+)
VVVSEDKKTAACASLDCPAQVVGRIDHYTSKRAMDIEGLGERRARQLREAGLLDGVPDVYRLKKDDLARLEGWGGKSAQNLLDEIEGSKDASLWRFLYALGIPHVGEHMAQVLARSFPDLDALMEASASELRAIEEVGPEMSQAISAFFGERRNREVIRDILSQGVELSNDRYAGGGAAQPLAGLTFVFTGELEGWTRDEAQDLVERHGARASSSVSSNTDYVVAGPGAGSKLDEAESREAVSVLDEEGFKGLLEERGVAWRRPSELPPLDDQHHDPQAQQP